MTSVTKIYCDRCGHEIPSRRVKNIDRFDFCECCYLSFQLWKSNQLNRNLKDAAEDDDDDTEDWIKIRYSRCAICGRDKADPNVKERGWGWGEFVTYQSNNSTRQITACPECASKIGGFIGSLSRHMHEEGSE